MPWYDYQCEKCGYVFEVQRAMSDTSKATCKSCKSSRTVKIFSPAGIQFKGSGFYVTDSRNGSTNGAAAPAEAQPTTDTKTEPDSKPTKTSKPAKAASKGKSGKSKPTAAGKQD